MGQQNLDTARGVNYMTNREKDMIKEINVIRSNPAGYIPTIEAYIQKTQAAKSNGTTSTGEEDEITVAKELIEELKQTAAIPTVQPHEGLYKTAKLHGEEGKAKGDLGHEGTNGSEPWDRVKKHAPDLGNRGCSENLVGGPADVQTSVIVLLVDSGIQGRGHRKNLLNSKWRYSTCYEVGKVGDMPYYWIQMFVE